MLEDLKKKWQDRRSWFLAWAEEAMFNNDADREQHFEALARQWCNALQELEEAIVIDFQI